MCDHTQFSVKSTLLLLFFKVFFREIICRFKDSWWWIKNKIFIFFVKSISQTKKIFSLIWVEKCYETHNVERSSLKRVQYFYGKINIFSVKSTVLLRKLLNCNNDKKTSPKPQKQALKNVKQCCQLSEMKNSQFCQKK